MTDDDPLDLAQVNADDTLIDQLRGRSLHPSDPVGALLRDLLADVEADLPEPAPVGRGSTVLALSGDNTPDRRLARRGTVVAVLTAGVVSLGGMAAASTIENPSHPLHGLGEAVRAAASAVVQAVTPPSAPPGSSARTPGGGSSGASVAVPAPAADAAAATQAAAADRSQAALRQVETLLDEAEQLLAAGRRPAASARLDSAERRLRDVLPEQRPVAARRLSELRERVAAATSPARPPARGQAPARGPAARPDSPAPGKQPQRAEQAGKPASPTSETRRGEPRPAPKGQQDESKRRDGPADAADASPTSNRLLPESRRAVPQSARVASTKPRA